MHLRRSAGVLLHLSSLPGSHGIGDLGRSACRFIDWLQAAGQSWWQVLPLGPVNSSASPYSACSSFAGNPLLISLEQFVELGVLTRTEANTAVVKQSSRVNYSRVKTAKGKLLRLAANRFFEESSARDLKRFNEFCSRERNWLADWALYSVLSKKYKDLPWHRWPAAASQRNKVFLIDARRSLKNDIRLEQFIQYNFFEQWEALRRYASSCGLRLIGDLPIYCAHDSADVWANPELFEVDRKGKLRKAAGVPPDYFSSSGQLWGMPVYRWSRHRAQRYRWWISRLQASLRFTDLLRIDHFRGIAGYWEVPGNAKTARRGRWRKGPGNEFLEAVAKACGEVPFIAEDLGEITPDVYQLRDEWELPGMRVLQFAFGSGADNLHLPFLHTKNSVVYPGTHDNAPAKQWFRNASAAEKNALFEYIGKKSNNIPWELIRLAYSSVAQLAVIPMQDVLGLGAEARMNVPGKAKGNWRWKLLPGQLKASQAAKLRSFAETYGRCA